MRCFLLMLWVAFAPAAWADLGGSVVRERTVDKCPLTPFGVHERCRVGKSRGLCEVAFFTQAALEKQRRRPDLCEGAPGKLKELGFTEADLAQLNPSRNDGVYCGFCKLPPVERPEVELSFPVVSGVRPVEEILVVLKAYRNQVRHCYEQALQRLPKLEATADLAFLLKGDGAPQNVSVQLEPADATLAKCLEGKAARWAFPKNASPEPGNQTDVKVRIRLKLIMD